MPTIADQPEATKRRPSAIFADAPTQADLRRWLNEVLAEEIGHARITDA
jgi:hypothetical protein